MNIALWLQRTAQQYPDRPAIAQAALGEERADILAGLHRSIILRAMSIVARSGGITDHAEAVKVTYDPAVVRYDQLLRIYFSVVADPTLKNRQGPDVGAHYRSAIVPMNTEQAAVAKAYIAQLGKAGIWKNPIVTRIEAYKAFYPAEAYHQDYMAINPTSRYIVRWDAPKVAALKTMFPNIYRASFLRDAG